jgi:uncharacterized protein YndB with AHSA1/START domain
VTEELSPIRLSIETAATPEVAWEALTDPARIAEWFTDAADLGNVGDAYRLDFGDGTVVEGIVTERDDGRRFGYTWAWAGDEPRAETVVSWTVEPLPGGGSRVSLEHDGWTAAGLDQATRADHSGYWEGYLQDLAEVLGEDGSAGTPGAG